VYRKHTSTCNDCDYYLYHLEHTFEFASTNYFDSLAFMYLNWEFRECSFFLIPLVRAPDVDFPFSHSRIEPVMRLPGENQTECAVV
jgi:hypothetical protein